MRRDWAGNVRNIDRDKTIVEAYMMFTSTGNKESARLEKVPGSWYNYWVIIIGGVVQYWLSSVRFVKVKSERRIITLVVPVSVLGKQKEICLALYPVRCPDDNIEEVPSAIPPARDNRDRKSHSRCWEVNPKAILVNLF
ncbi:hypothetical protein BDQ17DRAFT_1339845 [Cyathus striatus]|nr:hypothetical protein BDQ17DRAFT_1339845 [Cyathus striatus]